ncbi:hypothetical protein [Humibacillus xanthopallidus]|uniref:hypothetical protein n=1 Tax=Humibacillus xanthopallidus TaxID=412689 RepID=UPI00384AAF85
MRNIRICLYGGTDLKGTPTPFVEQLAYELLTRRPSVLVTGGFVHNDRHPTADSTDSAALRGARRAADDLREPLDALFEAWVPQGDEARVTRMTGDLGIRVRVAEGQTPLGRRLSMVKGVDLVVTIAGSRHTEVVVEQAVELGVPVLPLIQAGGVSKKMYASHKRRIDAAFAPGSVNECFKLLAGRLDGQQAPRCVVDVIETARLGQCLVLQPHRTESDEELYDSIIRPSVAEHMVPVRLKDEGGSELIHSLFYDTIARRATAVIADITDLNENVIYEIGYAHGRGARPLLFSLRSLSPDSLPLYLRTLRFHTVSRKDLPRLISNHLAKVKHAPRGNELEGT